MGEGQIPKGWHTGSPASRWIARFARLVPPGGTVLDVACGAGRHTRLFLGLGYRVVAVDRDLRGVADLSELAQVETHELDLEDGSNFPFQGRSFEGVVVANYLYRPILPDLFDAVATGGILIYETFAQGNERFGTPSNPEFLLRPAELLDIARPRLRVLAYEDLEVAEPKPAAVQRIAAVRPPGHWPTATSGSAVGTALR